MIIHLSEKKGNIILITDIYQTKDCIVFDIKLALYSKYKKTNKIIKKKLLKITSVFMKQREKTIFKI
jgi:hypothetical protein